MIEEFVHKFYAPILKQKFLRYGRNFYDIKVSDRRNFCHIVEISTSSYPHRISRHTTFSRLLTPPLLQWYEGKWQILGGFLRFSSLFFNEASNHSDSFFAGKSCVFWMFFSTYHIVIGPADYFLSALELKKNHRNLGVWTPNSTPF